MPTIILMRHANAELASPGMRDFDRPLSNQGWADAEITANLLKTVYFDRNNTKISMVFCSPACRTVETLAALRKTVIIEDPAINFLQELYAGDDEAYADLVKSVEADKVCVMIGHNPMIESFAFALAHKGDLTGLLQLKTGFPTSAIAVVELKNNSIKGELLHFFTAN